MPSLNTRFSNTPMPSKTPSSIPHATAEPNADFGPPAGRSKNRDGNFRDGRTPCGETAASHETRYYRIPRVLLLSVALDRTVECREHAAPDAKIAANDRCTCFDDGQRANKTLTLCTKMFRGAKRPLFSERTLGELRAPLIPCQIPPPTAPIANAPPKSFRITHGLRTSRVSATLIPHPTIFIIRTRDLLCGRQKPY